MASTTPVTRSVPSVHVRPVHLCRPVTICVHDTDCYAPSLLLRLRLRLRLLMSASFSQWCLIVHHHVPVGAGRTMLALGRYSTASTTMRLPHSSLPPFLPHGYCIPHHSSALCTLPHTLIAIHRVAPAPSDISPRTHLPQRRPPPCASLLCRPNWIVHTDAIYRRRRPQSWQTRTRAELASTPCTLLALLQAPRPPQQLQHHHHRRTRRPPRRRSAGWVMCTHKHTRTRKSTSDTSTPTTSR